MKVRKIVAGLAAMSMLAAFSMQPVFAASKVGVTAEKVTAAAGDTFTLKVELNDVPSTGINGVDFAVTYDTSVLTVTSVEAGSIVPGTVDSAEPIDGITAFAADTSTKGQINVTFSTGLGDSKYWITESGTFFTITGKVDAGAKAGTVAKVEIGAIDRETHEGSGTKNGDIVIAAVTDANSIVVYDAAVTNGSVTVAGGETPSEPTGDVKYGDVNVDGDVDIMDVIMLNKNLLGGCTLTPEGKANADVDRDGTPSNTDSMNIMKYIVGLIDALPVK